MKVQGTKTILDDGNHGAVTNESDVSQQDDPDHHHDGRIVEMVAGLPALHGSSKSDVIGQIQPNFDSEASQRSSSFLDHSALETDLKDDDFTRDLAVVCKRVFPRHKQSTYSTWEDLRQGVFINYGLWLPQFEKKANRRTIFEKIAKNLLIDAVRKERADIRPHDQFDLDQRSWDALPDRGSTDDKILNKILLEECRRHLTKAERHLFDEHLVNGESLRSIADRRNVSANAVSKKWIRIATKLQGLLT